MMNSNLGYVDLNYLLYIAILSSKHELYFPNYQIKDCTSNHLSGLESLIIKKREKNLDSVNRKSSNSSSTMGETVVLPMKLMRNKNLICIRWLKPIRCRS